MAGDREQEPVTSERAAAYFVPVRIESEPPAVEIRQVLLAVRERLRLILGATLLLGLAALLWAFLARPVYRASAQVMPVQTDPTAGPLASILNNVDGLAALAGFALGPQGGQDVEALALLKSRRLLYSFIKTHDLMPVMFRRDWDADAGTWSAGVEPPTIEDAYLKFVEDVLTIDEDKQTGLVLVKIDWDDPAGAAKLANGLISAVNLEMRKKALAEAEKSIKYLNEQLDKTNVLQVRESIYRLIEGQLQSAMLASVREETALAVVDHAVPPDPDKFVWPRRLWMAVGGAALGAFIGMLVAVIMSRQSLMQHRRAQSR